MYCWFLLLSGYWLLEIVRKKNEHRTTTTTTSNTYNSLVFALHRVSERQQNRNFWKKLFFFRFSDTASRKWREIGSNCDKSDPRSNSCLFWLFDCCVVWLLCCCVGWLLCCLIVILIRFDLTVIATHSMHNNSFFLIWFDSICVLMQFDGNFIDWL